MTLTADTMEFGDIYSSAYDSLYADKDYGLECDYLEKVFERRASGVRKVLDLGCGTGSHALILARRGYEVTGVDRSEGMINLAREKAAKAGLEARFVRGDIRDASLGARFDAVISMFAVIGYQTENSSLSRALSTARRHLAPGGLFIFDCWNGISVLKERPGVRVKDATSGDRRIIRIAEPELDLLNHVVRVRFRVWEMDGSLIAQETEEVHSMRFLFPAELRYYLETAGFKEAFFSPFLKDGEPLTEGDWNMSVVAVAG